MCTCAWVSMEFWWRHSDNECQFMSLWRVVMPWQNVAFNYGAPFPYQTRLGYHLRPMTTDHLTSHSLSQQSLFEQLVPIGQKPEAQMQVQRFDGFVIDSANYFTKEHDGDADSRCDNKCAGRCWHHDYPEQPSGALKEPNRMLARVACLAAVERCAVWTDRNIR